ncbi:hypothetical protein FACS1894170_11170 [Planctomycetales bacterium]|nr:hypothetical protein FACS1894170_11170 [Planctomycetales bacterium]
MEDFVGESYFAHSIYPYGTEYCPITALLLSKTPKVMYEKSSDKYWQGRANFFSDPHGNMVGYVITSVDVTDISRKTNELERAKDQAETASRHKSDFLARMSHELRTPMNAILGMNLLSQTRIKQLQGNQDLTELQQYLNEIRRSSEHLLNAINDILDISNLESGTVTLTSESLDLNAILDDVVHGVVLNCQSKKITSRVEIDTFDQPKVFVDGLRLRQILNCVLTNAVKFTPEGGNVCFCVKRKEAKDCKILVAFSVRDTGVGISADSMQRILQPFEQIEQEGALCEGNGLGLAIVQQLLALFGSKIEIQSEFGKGSEFSFEIWFEEDPETCKVSAAHSLDCFKGQRALVIDDVTVNRLVLVALLKEAGLITDEAKNGAEGAEKFAQSPEHYYSMVFMDIQMPIMNGYESTRAIRALDRSDARSVPIVAVSANAFQSDIDQSLSAGMNSHYAKPITRDTVFDILTAHGTPNADV